jgi:hypothetical protein
MKNFLAGIMFFLPGVSFAFTLSVGQEQKGWKGDTLSVRVNYSGCSISNDKLNAAIDEAIALWNAAPESVLTLKREGTSSATPGQGQAGTATEVPAIVCSTSLATDLTGIDASAADSIPAVTFSAADTSSLHINFGVMVLNSQSGAGADISTLTDTTLRVVIAHELGHILGLGHTASTFALMYYDATKKSTLALSQDDLDGLYYLYPRREPLGGMFGCGTVRDIGSGGSSGGAGGNGFASFCTLLGLLVLAGLAVRGVRRPQYE